MKVFNLLLVTVILSLTPKIKTEKPNDMNSLPQRQGQRPATTPSNPHMQLNQQPQDTTIIQELMNWAFSLADINREYSKISVPGAQAMCLSPDKVCTNCNAFMIANEFAHFHPHPDYSMHLGLTLSDVKIVIEKEWGELHPAVQKGWLPPNFIMLYAPRNKDEIETAKKIIYRSCLFAKGEIKDN
jgi:hypothetical protein